MLCSSRQPEKVPPEGAITEHCRHNISKGYMESSNDVSGCDYGATSSKSFPAEYLKTTTLLFLCHGVCPSEERFVWNLWNPNKCSQFLLCTMERHSVVHLVPECDSSRGQNQHKGCSLLDWISAGLSFCFLWLNCFWLAEFSCFLSVINLTNNV